MIVTFFLLCYYSAGTWKYVKKAVFSHISFSKNRNDNEDINNIRECPVDLIHIDAASEIIESQIRFYPPVYEQRYWTTTEILRKVGLITNLKKVADLGCSEMQFFVYLKQLASIEEIIFVDIDDDVLERFAARTRPYIADFLQKRETPLKVFVLNGDVSAPDKKLMGTDAVIAIELIEHLYPPTLEDLPYAVFGLIQPDIALFTTPNCEFNVVFPNFSGFRHADHKFEWSRSQFKDWACNLSVRYPEYEVYFKGIGPGPKGTEQFGHCSQMAVFYRKSEALKMDKSNEFCNEYRVIEESVYPVRIEERTEEEILRDEAENFIRKTILADKYLVNERFEIPFSAIMGYMKDACASVELLREILIKSNRHIEKLPTDEYAVIIPESGTYSESSCSYISEPNNFHEEEMKNIEVNYDLEECWDQEVCEEDKSEKSRIYHLDDIDQDRKEGSESGTKNEHLEEPQWLNSCESDNPSISIGKAFPRCHSFEQIQRRGIDFNKNNSFRFSLCEENRLCACDTLGAKNVVYSMEREISLEEIASGGSEVFACFEDSRSASKAVDSGYPNSSERDMETDLTPEQVDEIATESESSFEEGEEEESFHEEVPQLPPHPLPNLHPRWIDNMENGDVANNNRDWEGNNMEAEAQIGEPLQFENIIDQRDFAIPLDEAVPPEVDSDDENRFVSAVDFLNRSDDTLIGSQDSAVTPRSSFESRTEQRPDVVSSQSMVVLEDFSNQSVASSRHPSVVEESFPAWLLGILCESQDENDHNHERNDLDETEEIFATVEGDLLGGGDQLHLN